MNYSTSLLLLICLTGRSNPLEEPIGIQFFNGPWQQVLIEAKRQHKPVYVDFYTTWCPPCKRMAREAFPNTAVGEKFNQHFISYQVDAEVGEGFELARRYAVASYPTALYFMPTGELVHRAVGYAGVNAMLKQADMVLGMPQVRRFRRKRPKSTELVPPLLLNPIDSTKTRVLSDSL